jgi:hypothetical protein
LGDALKFLLPLRTQMPDHADAHVLLAEVYLRRGTQGGGGPVAFPYIHTCIYLRGSLLGHIGKPLLVLQALGRAQVLAPTHPHVHQLVCKVAAPAWAAVALAGRADAVAGVVRAALAKITGGHTPQALNDAFIAAHKNSLAHLLAGPSTCALSSGRAHALTSGAYACLWVAAEVALELHTDKAKAAALLQAVPVASNEGSSSLLRVRPVR